MPINSISNMNFSSYSKKLIKSGNQKQENNQTPRKSDLAYSSIYINKNISFCASNRKINFKKAQDVSIENQEQIKKPSDIVYENVLSKYPNMLCDCDKDFLSQLDTLKPSILKKLSDKYLSTSFLNGEGVFAKDDEISRQKRTEIIKSLNDLSDNKIEAMTNEQVTSLLGSKNPDVLNIIQLIKDHATSDGLKKLSESKYSYITNMFFSLEEGTIGIAAGILLDILYSVFDEDTKKAIDSKDNEFLSQYFPNGKYPD